jgi:hypothetical protein
MGRWIGSFLLIGLLPGMTTSCHKRQVLIPATTPAPAPAAASSPAPAPARPTEEIPTPPTLAPSTETPQPESVIPNPPPAPPPAAPKPTRRNPPRPAAPATPAPTPAAPAAPAPQLGIILTPDQQRQYNSDIDQSLQRADASLKSIGSRQLSSEQQASLDEARNFIRQAQATRATDLPAALRLAERADVLARNLAGSLR